MKSFSDRGEAIKKYEKRKEKQREDRKKKKEEENIKMEISTDEEEDFLSSCEETDYSSDED